jgi:hypothetical protein
MLEAWSGAAAENGNCALMRPLGTYPAPRPGLRDSFPRVCRPDAQVKLRIAHRLHCHLSADATTLNHNLPEARQNTVGFEGDALANRTTASQVLHRVWSI